jgi:hypothetical protein
MDRNVGANCTRQRVEFTMAPVCPANAKIPLGNIRRRFTPKQIHSKERLKIGSPDNTCKVKAYRPQCQIPELAYGQGVRGFGGEELRPCDS